MVNSMIFINDLNVFYGGSHILKGITTKIEEGITALVGRNGMGKTTLVKSIMGLVPISNGGIIYEEKNITNLKPFQIASEGIGYVPQGRHIFPSLTVEEHLMFAAREGKWDVEEVYKLFPALKERRGQSGTNLSGGEQQMLAIGRALVTNPKLLIMDEPSEGLAPVVVNKLINAFKNLNTTNISILLVEQNLKFAESVADSVQVLVSGDIVYKGTFNKLLSSQKLTQKYLGVGFTKNLD